MNNKNFLFGVAYLYAIIWTMFFSIGSILSMIIISSAYPDLSLNELLLPIVIQLLVLVATIFTLFRLNKKQNLSLRDILNDSTTRKSAGILILLGGLISLSTYVPVIILTVSLKSDANYNVNVLSNCANLALILFRILSGTYLLKSERKTNGQYNVGSLVGIAYLYIIITAVFSFLSELLTIAFGRQSSLNIYQDALWFVVLAVMIFVLYKLNKKHNHGLYNLLSDITIIKSTASVIIIDGLLDLPSILLKIINIIYILNSFDDYHITSIVAFNSIKLLFTLLQIFLGTYLLKFYKIRTDMQKAEE